MDEIRDYVDERQKSWCIHCGCGEIDPGSRALGDLEGTMRALKESFDKHCDDDDRRHQENCVRTPAMAAAA
jgi:hypothetical protein